MSENKYPHAIVIQKAFPDKGRLFITLQKVFDMQLSKVPLSWFCHSSNIYFRRQQATALRRKQACHSEVLVLIRRISASPCCLSHALHS